MPEDEPGTDEVTQDTPESGTDDERSPATEDEKSSPAIDWESEDNPYKQRYGDLRPEYDRYQNFVRALEDPQMQPAILRRMGIELEEEDALEDPLDAEEPMTRAEFQDYLSRQQEAQDASYAEEQNLDADTSDISGQIDAIEKEYGEGAVSDELLDLLLPAALQNRDPETGEPRFKDVFDKFSSTVQGGVTKYVKTKKVTGVQGGSAGTEKIDMTDDDARQQAMLADIEAAEQGQL